MKTLGDAGRRARDPADLRPAACRQHGRSEPLAAHGQGGRHRARRSRTARARSDHDDARRFGIAARIYDIGHAGSAGRSARTPRRIDGPDAARLLGPHVERSGEVFAKERTGLVELAAIIAHQHHERFDGRGYPEGIDKHDISIYAQLVAVAEMFNDVTTVGSPAHGHRDAALRAASAGIHRAAVGNDVRSRSRRRACGWWWNRRIE